MDRKVLLVDDWHAVRLLGRRVLSSLGFQTREARSRAEALEILSAEPDILAVLLEWKPQALDNLDLLKSLAGLSRSSRPAVIACGDRLERTQIAAALEAGADDFIQKPYSRETVRDKLAQLGISDPENSRQSEPLSSSR